MLPPCSDRRLITYNDFNISEWSVKADHLKYVREAIATKGKNLKLVLMYVGLFHETVFGVSHC